ncbi:hypothetical protein SAMN05444159_6652 [Bradyrhizobium lablabi]|uniref:PXPV repeat-containing protein n=1 Tax=Bradyrhizobium lablabi TaxID=722472 RepID=A0A1M7CZ19_9BRAD|nr:hypothetical protein [Bradyrhizobium lablabi]SHL72502.1 hypothetical protein SAMN05444159_6652 [Bradyrhizobium lablabi]
MRQMISGLVAAVAVVSASAVPAMACGGGLFGSCSPCGAYVSPCAQPEVYVAPVAPVYSYSYSGCNSCGGAYERLPDPVDQYQTYTSPVHQYYYVNQGPTYGGPGNFAPYPVYRESEGPSVYGYPHYHRWHHRYHSYRYGYAPRYSYHAAAPYYYGHRVLRRYY